MEITVDNKAGYCHGVRRSIEMAEQALGNEASLYCLGELVHNDAEMARLAGLGLQMISRGEFNRLKNATVLLRAHGEPPETYRIAKENNITLIDTTCPVVEKLQQRVYCSYEEMGKNGGQVVIFGKKEHPEVVGLLGQAGEKALVVATVKDLEQIDFGRPVHLFSQTTKDRKEYNALIGEIKKRINAAGSKPAKMLTSRNTICGQVSNRLPEMERLAATNEVVVFVAGKNSSNGKALFGICKTVNPNTYFVSGIEELNKEWFKGIEKIAVTGATSTPVWQLAQVKEKIEQLG